MSNRELNIGIAGLGTVGIGIFKILESNKTLLRKKTDANFNIRAVSAKNKDKIRDINLGGTQWTEDPVDLAEIGDIDIIIEVMGGSSDPAKALVENALQNGKHVVTANKALLATHGHSLAMIAEENNVALRFEAAVAGGIPIIKALIEGLASNSIYRIAGVLNGTCNYILTRMEATGNSYKKIFEEAESLGYVEANPKLDVGGIDAAQKLALLSSIGFQNQIDFGNIEIEGIEKISLFDIENAKEMGYRIKLLGIAQLTDHGLYQEVQPCLVREESAISKLEGGTNMVIVDSDFIGRTFLSGPGAGQGPTASAIVSDLLDVANSKISPVFGSSASTLEKIKKGTKGINRCYYLRLSLVDEPGALAQVATVLGNNKISIDRMRQKAHDGNVAPILIVTHETTFQSVKTALAEIKDLDVCLQAPVSIKIEEM